MMFGYLIMFVVACVVVSEISQEWKNRPRRPKPVIPPKPEPVTVQEWSAHGIQRMREKSEADRRRALQRR